MMATPRKITYKGSSFWNADKVSWDKIPDSAIEQVVYDFMEAFNFDVPSLRMRKLAKSQPKKYAIHGGDELALRNIRDAVFLSLRPISDAVPNDRVNEFSMIKLRENPHWSDCYEAHIVSTIGSTKYGTIVVPVLSLKTHSADDSGEGYSSQIGSMHTAFSTLDNQEKYEQWESRFLNRLNWGGLNITMNTDRLKKQVDNSFSNNHILNQHYLCGRFGLKDDWRNSWQLLEGKPSPFPIKVNDFKVYMKGDAPNRKLSVDAQTWDEMVEQIEEQLDGDEISFCIDSSFNDLFPINVFSPDDDYKNRGLYYSVSPRIVLSKGIEKVEKLSVLYNFHAVKNPSKYPMLITTRYDEVKRQYVFDRGLYTVKFPYASYREQDKAYHTEFLEWKNDHLEKIKERGKSYHWTKKELNQKNFNMIKWNKTENKTKIHFYVFEDDGDLKIAIFSSYGENVDVMLDVLDGEHFNLGGSDGKSWFHNSFLDDKRTTEYTQITNVKVERPDPYKTFFWPFDKTVTKEFFGENYDAKCFVVVPPMRDYGIVNF